MIVVLMMYKKGPVMELKCALITEELKYMGFIFVDDMDLTAIAKEDENIKDVKKR